MMNDIILRYLVYDDTYDIYDPDNWRGILELGEKSEGEIEDIEEIVDNYLKDYIYVDDKLITYDLERGYAERTLIFKYKDELFACDYNEEYDGIWTNGECVKVKPTEITEIDYIPEND